MKTLFRSSLLVAVILGFVAALLFAFRDPKVVVEFQPADHDRSATLDTARPTAESETPPLELPGTLPASVLVSAFAVRPVPVSPEPRQPDPVPVEAVEEEPLQELETEAPVGPTAVADWLVYVGRVGDETGEILFYFRDTRSGRMRSIGRSASADYQMIDLINRVLRFEGPEQTSYSVEVPE